MTEWIIENPLNPNQAEDFSTREEAYVDLSVISGETADTEWLNSDREDVMDLKYLKQESICLDKIWEPTDQLVIVRGVAGIGKSTMIKRYVLKWAKDEILTDNNGRIEFLFFLECCELNAKPNLKSLDQLLREGYPHVFKHLDLFDLQNISDRVMIVVDGLDELQGIYKNVSEDTTTKLIKTMVNTKSTLLKGHKTIACGRPKACEFIKSKMPPQKTKLVEVCGFDEKKTIEFIECFFKGDLKRAKKVKEIIKRPNPRVMSSIPMLLWAICLLYSEDFDEEIDSATELYTYGLFTFLKKHLRGNKNLEEQNIRNLVSTQKFSEIVYSLAKLSVKTYMRHQMVFTDDDIKEIHCPIHLEQSGLIVKHSTGNGCEAYQFKHLVFQEYLCALFLCLAKGVSQFRTNRELSSCTPTILGIHCLISEGTSQLFVPFYRSLLIVHNISRSKRSFLKTLYERYYYRKFINRHSKIAKMIEQHIKKDEYGRKRLICDNSDYKFNELMRNFRESKRLMDEDKLQDLLTECYIKVTQFNKRSSLEILEFLKSLKVQSINKLGLISSLDGRFEKSDFDLIEISQKSSTLWIIFSNNCTWYSSKKCMTCMYISKKDLLASNFNAVLSTEIKECHTSYVVKLPHNYNIIQSASEEILDNIFQLVTNLIEEVLANDDKESLTIEKILNLEQHERLICKIEDEFKHREDYFDKIKIDVKIKQIKETQF